MKKNMSQSGFPPNFYGRLHAFISSHFYSNTSNTNGTNDESKSDFKTNDAKATVNVPEKDVKLKILDLGSGPGVISLILAEKYPNSMITGVDISENQIKYAKILSQKRKLDKNSEFFVGGAETIRKDIGNKYSNYFDIVICGQCWYVTIYCDLPVNTVLPFVYPGVRCAWKKSTKMQKLPEISVKFLK